MQPGTVQRPAVPELIGRCKGYHDLRRCLPPFPAAASSIPPDGGLC